MLDMEYDKGCVCRHKEIYTLLGEGGETRRKKAAAKGVVRVTLGIRTWVYNALFVLFTLESSFDPRCVSVSTKTTTPKRKTALRPFPSLYFRHIII